MKQRPPFAPLKIPALTTLLALLVLKSGLWVRPAPDMIADGFLASFRLGLIVAVLVVARGSVSIIERVREAGKLRNWLDYYCLLAFLGLQVSIIVAFISPLALIVAGLLWRAYPFAAIGGVMMAFSGAIFGRIWFYDLFSPSLPLGNQESLDVEANETREADKIADERPRDVSP